MTLIGVMGFFTYADDLRHSGEIAVAVGLLLSGVCILISLIYPKTKSTIGLPWTAGTIIMGLIAGTAVDSTLYGLIVAIPVGTLIGYWKRSRETSTST